MRLSHAETVHSDLTGPGMVLGTVRYMAPEQVEGRAVDARTDIFAFGAVLYEMLTGRKAFDGKTQASLIAAIMNVEPTPVSALAPIAPRALDRLVSRCLAKDPDDRWQTAHDLLLQLRWIAGRGAKGGAAAATGARARREPLTLAALAAGRVDHGRHGVSRRTATCKARRSPMNSDSGFPLSVCPPPTWRSRPTASTSPWWRGRGRSRRRCTCGRSTPSPFENSRAPTTPRNPSGRPTAARLVSSPAGG